eukprot:COSAG01_NODE_623_length_14742_cov_22.391177_20_plen_90_part_00
MLSSKCCAAVLGGGHSKCRLEFGLAQQLHLDRPRPVELPLLKWHTSLRAGEAPASSLDLQMVMPLHYHRISLSPPRTRRKPAAAADVGK